MSYLNNDYTKQSRNEIIQKRKKIVSDYISFAVCKRWKDKRVMEKGQPTEVEHEGLEDRQHLGTAPQTDGC